jgi:hypothetical protein
LIGGILLPGFLLALAAWWPFRDKTGPQSTGAWFAPERRRQNMIFIAVMILIIIFTIIGTYLRGPYWGWYWPWEVWPEMPQRF